MALSALANKRKKTLGIFVIASLVAAFVLLLSSSTTPPDTKSSNDEPPFDSISYEKEFGNEVVQSIAFGDAFDAQGCADKKGNSYNGLEFSVVKTDIVNLADFAETHPNYFNFAPSGYAQKGILLVTMRVHNCTSETRGVNFSSFTICEHNQTNDRVHYDKYVIEEMFGVDSNSANTREKDLPDGFFLINAKEMKDWTLPYLISLEDGSTPEVSECSFEGAWPSKGRVEFLLE